jgi:hypothetical protein
MRGPILTAEQHRRLTKFWQRQKSEINAAATVVTRREMGEVMHANGQLKTVASKMAGDVVGVMLASVVQAIRGILIDPTPPTNGQGLVYDAVLDRLVYNELNSSTRWEPVTNGDPDDPQILFSADGDVLMSEVPN